MSLICMNLRMELCSDAIFSSGNSTPGGEDIALRVDQDGQPFLPGATLKGLLRESVGDWLSWTQGDPVAITALFGREGWNGGQASPDLEDWPVQSESSGRRLIFGDLRLEPGQPDWSLTRTFTALEDQVVKTGTLRTASCLRKGLVFRGQLFCDQEDETLIQKGCAALKWAGLLRNRGFGRVRVTAARAGALAHRPAVAGATCLRYRLELATALAVPQYSRSMGGWHALNYMDTKRYLPGSALRGWLLSTLARERPDWFEAHKARLLGDGVRFLDALPVREGRSAIPTPMGFYEDKAETRFYSVLLRDAEAGDKRAKVGPFCTLEAGEEHPRLRGFAPKTTLALRMRRSDDPEGKQVFSGNAMAPGTVLEGYIQLDDPELAADLSGAFYDWVWLGADKYAGNGLCRVLSVEGVPDRYGADFGFQPGDQIPSELYMMLLSPTTMGRAGEPVGLEPEALADLLELPACPAGQHRLEIAGYATSVTEQVTFNSTWGCATPVEVMYAAGSVFRLKCVCPPDYEALHRLEQTGLGLRRCQGCGQVLFLKDYTRYQKFREDAVGTKPSRAAELRRARCRWLLENDIPSGMSASQLGDVQVLCQQAIAQRGDLRELEEFFRHNLEDRGARNGARFQGFYQWYQDFMTTPLGETLGVENCPDGRVEKLRLICDWLDLSRKEVGK